MYMAGALSSSAPFAVGDLGSEQGGRRGSHTEHISVDITEVEVRCITASCLRTASYVRSMLPGTRYYSRYWYTVP